MAIPGFKEIYLASVEPEIAIGIFCDQCGTEVWQGFQIDVEIVLQHVILHKAHHEMGEADEL